ncbi:MAG: serine protease inhibitor ecotin [Dysgonomonas sp.]|nr:serine protease inhibitor ecotin [Dysgonomonas sp.]
MKTITKFLLIAVTMLSFTGLANAQDFNPAQDREKMLAPFPKAEEGMVRYVIYLDKHEDESLYKVEIVPGKVMSVDCNHHSLMGKLEEKDLQGWGYTYYNFTSNGQTRSTMMACNKPNEEKFVQSMGLMVRYNSKLPIVVYAPKGYEIKYRVWYAGALQASPVL